MYLKGISFSFILIMLGSCSDVAQSDSNSTKAAFNPNSFKKATTSNFSSTYGGTAIASSNAEEYDKVKNQNANFSSYGDFDPTKNSEKTTTKKKVSKSISSSYSNNSSKKNYAAEAKKNATFSAYGQN